jgi:hypothetical protein
LPPRRDSSAVAWLHTLGLARMTDSRPMQYRMVRPIVIAAGLNDAAADVAIAYAVER